MTLFHLIKFPKHFFLDEKRHQICGGVSHARPVEENHLKIWNLVRHERISECDRFPFEFQYKDSVEKKLREQFQIPEFYPLTPIEVSTQVVAGINYFFKVKGKEFDEFFSHYFDQIELPEQRFVTVRITHGKTEGLGQFSIDDDQS